MTQTTYTPERIATALAVVTAFDAAAAVPGQPGMPAAVSAARAALPGPYEVTEADVKELLRDGAHLQHARDETLDELAQVALAMDVDEVRADRPAAYARITEEHLAEWLPEVAGDGTTPAAVRAMLNYLRAEPDPRPRATQYGTLTDYTTGEAIRPATVDEAALTEAAIEFGDATGAFTIDRDGQPCPAAADPAVFGPIRTVYVA